MSIGSDHSGRTYHASRIDVLVTVQKPPRMMPGDVVVEGGESPMDIVLTVVDEARGVVSYEHIYP